MLSSNADDVVMADLSVRRFGTDASESASEPVSVFGKERRPRADPLATRISLPQELSTKQKLLAVVDEVEVIYDTFIGIISSQSYFQSDPAVATLLPPNQGSTGTDFEPAALEQTLQEIISLLAERQQDFESFIADAAKEAEVEIAVQGLIVESDKLKDQVMLLQARLKEAEQILSNALHMTKTKTEAIKSADDAQLSMDDIIRYAHRISVGFSAAAPGNWVPGDPRRPYPTEVEMRAGLLASKSSDIPPPPSHILALPTQNLTDVSQKFLGSNAGPYTMSPQLQTQGPVDSPKNSMTTSLQREVSADEQDVETMSSDTSSSSSSEEE